MNLLFKNTILDILDFDLGKAFSDLWNNISNFFKGLASDLWDIISNFFKGLVYLIPQLLYWIGSSAMMIIDFMQLVFRKLAGLDVYAINGIAISEDAAVIPGLSGSGDMILTFIYKILFTKEFSAISVAFQSLIILSAIILFAVTIAAIIKNEYSPDKEKKNSKEGIIKSFFKAIVSFVLIPITCFFGAWVGNIILYGVDQAIDSSNTSSAIVDSNVKSMLTKTDDKGNESKNYTFYSFFGTYTATNYTTLTSLCFNISAYSGNRIRLSESFYHEVWDSEEIDGVSKNLGIAQSGYTKEQAADLIDALFTMNARFNPDTAHYLDTSISSNDDGIFFVYGNSPVRIESFDRYNLKLVNCFYDLWQINWLVMILFIVMILSPMLAMVMGVVKRLFNMLALFLMSPIVCSFMPIDGGSAFKAWTKEFVRQVATLYVSVFAFNLFFMLCPILNSISIFGPNQGVLMDRCVNAILVVGALSGVKEFDKIINLVIFGYKDGGMMASGASAIDDAKKTFESAAGKVGAVAKVGAGAVRMGAGAAKFAAGAAGFAGGAFASGIAKHNAKKNLGKDAANAGNMQKHQGEALDELKKDKDYKNEVQSETDKIIDEKVKENEQKQVDEYKESLAADTKSNYNAQKAWEQMSNEERSKYKSVNTYLSGQYKSYKSAHKGEDVMSYEDWKKQGEDTRKDEADGFASHIDKEQTRNLTDEDKAQAQKEAESRVNSRLAATMQSGQFDKDDKLGAKAVEEYNQKKLKDEEKLQRDKNALEKKGKATKFRQASFDKMKEGFGQLSSLGKKK